MGETRRGERRGASGIIARMVLTLALLLHASLAIGESAPPASPAAKTSPAPAATAPSTPAAPPPAIATPAPGAIAPAGPVATPTPGATPAAPSTPPSTNEADRPERGDAAAAAARSRAAPTAAVSEKLAQGDRAFAAGDLRGALFAYQDAVYLQPAYAFSRVKLGRAYLGLRYPALAIAQAELALAADPGSADAQRLLDDARKPPAPPTSPSPVIAPRAPDAAAPRVYRLTPDPEPAPSRVPASMEAAAQPAPANAAARQSYLLALDLIGRQDYAGAIGALDDAIANDPRLAVAYAARASARIGLRRYREAADDYKASLGLDASYAMPLYGLAECYRLLGDPAAGQMYERYAASRAPDVREDLRGIAAERARELSRR